MRSEEPMVESVKQIINSFSMKFVVDEWVSPTSLNIQTIISWLSQFELVNQTPKITMIIFLQLVHAIRVVRLVTLTEW